MKPRINVLTLGVSDLGRAMAFYRDGLGLSTPGIVGQEFKGDDTHPSGTVAFFELKGGLIFALYPRTELAKDAKLPISAPSPTEFSIRYAVEAKQDVDTLLKQAKKAGATITEPPHDRPWGIYSGYFQDPDGHLWEVVWNPGLEITD